LPRAEGKRGARSDQTAAAKRAGRDINAAVKHGAMSPQNYLVAGRINLGMDPGTTRF
jgi:hypothetical protein